VISRLPLHFFLVCLHIAHSKLHSRLAHNEILLNCTLNCIFYYHSLWHSRSCSCEEVNITITTLSLARSLVCVNQWRWCCAKRSELVQFGLTNFKDCVAFKLNWRKKRFAVQCVSHKNSQRERWRIIAVTKSYKMDTSNNKRILSRSLQSENHCKAQRQMTQEEEEEERERTNKSVRKSSASETGILLIIN
jgi:hypothetical protein